MVFLVAFSVLLVGALLRSQTSDLQISRNHISSMKALFVADAGVEDAIAELRDDYTWNTGFTGKVFPSGSTSSYTVEVTNNQPTVEILSTGMVNGYVRKIQVELTVGDSSSPYSIRVIYWKEL